MDILVITTGGTFDKVYFDAKSDYQVGEPYVGNLLEEGNVTLNYEILSILKKDSLDIKEEDRILIKDKVSSATQDKIVIIHGTDTMIDTAKVLEGINKTIVLTGSMQPARFKNSDATFNVGFALGSALSLSHGVYIAMSGRIFSPKDVKKNIDLGRFENNSWNFFNYPHIDNIDTT